MKYFIDTEFHEYHKQQKICEIKIGKDIPTIDLISIAIVSEDIDSFSKRTGKTDRVFKGKEYYAISRDFNIKDAWNSWQPKIEMRDAGMSKVEVKEYWLRDNVLKPIFDELLNNDNNPDRPSWYLKTANVFTNDYETIIFTLKNFKRLIDKYGKTNKQIAEEVHSFIYVDYLKDTGLLYPEAFSYSHPKYDPIFYAYYADYDWVVFCQLFGKMINLPKGFPMYCIDLKQSLDEVAESLTSSELSKLAHGETVKPNAYSTYDTGVLKCSKLDLLKNAIRYPKQDNEHNALDDAKWNLELYKFINSIQK